jgi:ATP-dependent RNA helicase DDX41
MHHHSNSHSVAGYSSSVCLFTELPAFPDLSFSFSGRDIIGIAFTGSGKTLAFCLPLIMLALEEEKKLPFVRGEGPVGIILCPSRELANQTFENVNMWCSALAHDNKYPQLNSLLCIGGIAMNEQSHVLGKGIHIVIATPGRLIDMLEKKRFTFNNCKFLCMDEADRMIDLGFEDDVRNIISFFKVRLLYMFRASSPDMTIFCSGSVRRSYSLRQCRERSKILHGNLSSNQCW